MDTLNFDYNTIGWWDLYYQKMQELGKIFAISHKANDIYIYIYV
jgi:hypothetical protein